MSITAVIDGDLLLYKVGFAAEKRTVKAVHSSGDVEEHKTRTALKKSLEGSSRSYDEYTIEDVQTPEPVENALHSVKVMVERLKKECNADKIEIYLGKGESFRTYFDLPYKYKGQRSDIKPIHKDAIADYLVNKYKAQYVEHIEADDKVCMRGYDGWKSKGRETTIVCSTDKDATHGPCILYNWDKMEHPTPIQGLGSLSINNKSKVSGHGRSFMYFQWVWSDPVDHYAAADIANVKWGEMGAYKLLKDCKTDKDYVEAVLKKFKGWYDAPGGSLSYTTWRGDVVEKTWIEIAQMYLDCCRMLRWEGDVVTIEQMCNNLKIDLENL